MRWAFVAALALAALVRPVACVLAPRLGLASHAAWPGAILYESAAWTIDPDPWGESMSVRGRNSASRSLRSAGPDRTWHTKDDIHLGPDDLAQGLALAAIPIGAACAGLIGLWFHAFRGPASRSPSNGVEVARAAWLATGPTLVLWAATFALLVAWPTAAYRSIESLLPRATGMLALPASTAALCAAFALGWRLGRPLDESR